MHALPLLAALRGRWGGARIGWLCEPGGVQLLDGHPMIDRVHVVPKPAWRENKMAALRGPIPELVAELRGEHYDVSIDVQGLTKSALWPRLARIPRRIGFRGAESREISGILNNTCVRPTDDTLHVVERNMALLEPLGFDRGEPITFPVHLSESARQRADEILGEGGNDAPLVVMSPGAGWATKIWPTERFGRLARLLVERFGYRVAIAWGPGEESLVREVLNGAGENQEHAFQNKTLLDGPGVHPMPATRFMDLAAVIARARLFVGGDTGPTHMAAALGVPTVSMMGPLDARRNGPLGDHCVTIQHDVPRRAPFWCNHRRWCDPATDLRDVTVEEIFGARGKIFSTG